MTSLRLKNRKSGENREEQTRTNTQINKSLHSTDLIKSLKIKGSSHIEDYKEESYTYEPDVLERLVDPLRRR